MVILSKMHKKKAPGAGCWCNDTEKTESKTCVVCSHTETILMHPYYRELRCPFHHPVRVVETKHVCDSCAGTGGGDALYNRELNLEIVKGKIVAYDRERSSSTEDDDDDEKF